MAMAISSCSSKHSPKLPNISLSSSYSTKSHSCHSNHGAPLLQSHSPPHYTCRVAQQAADTFVLPSGGILHLTEAASARVLERESDVEFQHDEATTRSRRRRRRRKRINTLERIYNDDEDEDEDEDIDDDAFVFSNKKAGKSRFMTSKEEAKFSRCLKERARVEAVRRELLAEIEGDEVSPNVWAKAAGISRRKLDKILWNGRESEKRITSCYHGLVVSIASSYLGKGLTLQDLAQEGSIGLLRGAIKFDPEKGYKLSTYAYWWIRQSITRAIAKKSKIIRLPDIIPGPAELTPEAMMRKEVVKREIEKLLEALCEREARILRLHYGLNGESLLSFEEIGRLLKLSRERVRQINSAALLKLREASQEDDLNYFIA